MIIFLPTISSYNSARSSYNARNVSVFERVREVAMMFRKSLANNFLSSDTCRGFKRRSSARANCQR